MIVRIMHPGSTTRDKGQQRPLLWSSSTARRTLHQVPSFLRPAQSAENLAAVRIICCTAALLWSRPDRLVAQATLDAPTIPPAVSGELLLALPRSEGAVVFASWLLTAALLSALVGWRTRGALITAVATSWFVVGLAQSFGKVDHNHHLLWALLILAVSPCADALSVDSFRRGRCEVHPAYGFPVRMIWLVIGLAYFFAGVWKLGGVGVDWALSDNLRDLIWNERLARGGYEPLIDITGSPLLYRFAGAGALLFELSFVFLIFTRARPLAVAMGVAFHMGTWMTMGIGFLSLVSIYGVLFDWTQTVSRFQQAWHRLRQTPAARAHSSAQGASAASAPVVRTIAVVIPIALSVAVALAGAARELNGWPVASYPDFGYRPGDRQSMVSLRAGSLEQKLPGLSEIQQHRLLVRAVRSEDAFKDAQSAAARSDMCSRLEPGQAIHIQIDRVRVTDEGLIDMGPPERVLLLQCDAEGDGS